MSTQSDSAQLKRLSKFLSLVLRHEPDLVGLELELGGWVPVDRLIEGMARAGRQVTRADVDYVVANNDKGRFSFDATGTRIRANQGHSADVDLQLSPVMPPAVLYHGTHGGAMEAIRREGLRKMERHAVHLSVDILTASKVGGRRGKPIILEVDAQGLLEAGFLFYCSDNGVWLTEQVPSAFILFPEE